jgi:hypothetical protein
MTTFKAAKTSDGAFHMVVFGDHHAVGDGVAQHLPGGLGHLPGGFSGCCQEYPAGEGLALQGPLNGPVGQNSLDGPGYDSVGVTAKKLIHKGDSFFCYLP